jgi:hypothetical protein
MFGAAWGQENEQTPLVNKKPLNEIKVDIGPLFVPLFLKDFIEPIYVERYDEYKIIWRIDWQTILVPNIKKIGEAAGNS